MVNDFKNVIRPGHFAESFNRFLLSYSPKPAASIEKSRSGLPKIIWMLWCDGLDAAPEVVRLAHRTWVEANPDYTVVFLDSDSLSYYLGFDILNVFDNASIEMGPVQRSDFLRYLLLNYYGGVWAEASAFCTKPLSSWIDDEIFKTGYFCFRQASIVPDRQFISWFQASAPKSKIIESIFSEVVAYLFKPRKQKLTVGPIFDNRDYIDTGLVSREGTGYDFLNWRESKGETPYFWTFYLFNEVVKKFPQQWANIREGCNAYSFPHHPLSRFTESYVSKLTYKDDYEQSDAYKQRIDYLFTPEGRYRL